MTTLYLSPRYSTESIAVRNAAQYSGIHVHRLNTYRVPEECQGKGGAYYGETLFGYAMAPLLGIELVEPAPEWLPELPQIYRKREIALQRLSEVSWSGPRFVKCVGEKSFPAGVYCTRPAQEGNVLVQVALPAVFLVEYRAFVYKRSLLDLSLYAVGGLPSAVAATIGGYTAAQLLLTQLLSDPKVVLPEGVVIDVGLAEGLGWCVIEANPAWGSSLYGCSATRVLPAILASCGVYTSGTGL